ncbi:ATP-dependent DNA ligase [Marinivivus vitaminiproducens]|uniref:ATP-dependent DNA ligase n=1 Tax=Marinivivus vitaminiproducens TaxID=3035935 RepID=UPI00279F95FE|nr:ATP-dependent DNA ligase [Geminicoccaceae bacterium SCSIO 64248]
MRRFAALYRALDGTTKTNAKIAAMEAYFAQAPADDAAWAVFFLRGERPKRLIGSGKLRGWAEALTGLPSWLMLESYASVGDSAETVALLLDQGRQADEASDLSLSRWMSERILPLRDRAEPEQAATVAGWWAELDREQTFVLNKLLTGALRVGVSQGLVVRAIAQASGLEPGVVAHRLMGHWRPTPEAYAQLTAEASGEEDRSRPYPFFLASQLEQPVESLGDPADWLIEWKWDGIRAQVIRRGGEVYVWSRGEELVTDRYPEIRDAAGRLPDGTVLDGEILAWGAEGVLPFAVLQRRIGRDRPGAKILADAPVRFLAYDILEETGRDIRERPMRERRGHLEAITPPVRPIIGLSERVEGEDWTTLAQRREGSRALRVEGLMLKRWDSAYGHGRRRGFWWKWKIAPMTVDAVLVYAQAGSGRRSNLFTDYGFAVWRDDELVPIAKAYSGLDDKEIATLDRWIRGHTQDRFGPVRMVQPHHVFELAFEGINPSNRHKAGLALRFPRIARWRHDKNADEADRLESLHGLIQR